MHTGTQACVRGGRARQTGAARGCGDKSIKHEADKAIVP